MPTPIVTVSQPIKTREQMNQALSELLSSDHVDWTNIGVVKPHEERTEAGAKTGEILGMYLTSQFRLPGVHAATFDGDKFYTKNLAVKVDFFKLSESEFAVTPTAAKSEAASIDAGTLKERIAQAKAYAATKTQKVASPA